MCSDNHGGGLLIGILFPLYDTAGETNLIGPARGCYLTVRLSIHIQDDEFVPVRSVPFREPAVVGAKTSH